MKKTKYVALEILSTGLHQVIAIEDNGYVAWGKLMEHLANTEEGQEISVPMSMEGDDGLMITHVSNEDYPSYWCVLPFRDYDDEQ